MHTNERDISPILSPAVYIGGPQLRIDNRRQSVIRTTLHCSLALSHTISCHMPYDSLYFCLSNHINDAFMNLISLKL